MLGLLVQRIARIAKDCWDCLFAGLLGLLRIAGIACSENFWDLGMSARSTFRAPKSVELAEKLKEGSLVKNNNFWMFGSIRSQSGAEFYYFHSIIFRSRNTS